jgi:hypothetical protein
MFCPKCGSQNADETKFCRGCGVELSALLVAAPASGRKARGGADAQSLAEKHLEIYSRGLSGLMIGVGLILVAALALALTTASLPVALFSLIFGVVFLSMGVSRLVQARGLKALAEREEPAALPTGQTEYIKPVRSVFDTDDLSAVRVSVTENTTRHLELGAEDELSKPAKP